MGKPGKRFFNSDGKTELDGHQIGVIGEDFAHRNSTKTEKQTAIEDGPAQEENYEDDYYGPKAIFDSHGNPIKREPSGLAIVNEPDLLRVETSNPYPQENN